MELRVLKYFLAVAREQNVTKAAQTLHLSQPTLSRQLRDLEEELGKQLLIRKPRQVTLTEEGRILKKRAEEILSLVDKAEQEIRTDSEDIAGDIYIGAGETKAGHILTQTASKIQLRHPNIRLHIISGDTVNVLEQLDQGLIDFGLIFAPIDHTRYHVLDVPEKDIWGCLMRSDHPLAAKPSVTPEDLKTQPLIISRQARDSDTLSEWFGIPLSSLHIAATYSLVYNATLMVEDGIGCALCLDGIINSAGSGLVFRPLSPSQTASMSIIWKKNQIFSGASDCFLSALQESLTER